MKERLTDTKLRSLKAPETGRIEISDTERPGLKFRLTSKGAASWLFRKQVKGGTKRGFTLGTYPAMTLSAARKLALEIHLECEQGIDRVLLAEQETARLAAEAATSRTVQDVLELYISNHINKELKAGQSREERKRQLRTYLEPHFAKAADELTRADVQIIVDGKLAEGKKVMANRIRAAISAFTTWAYKRGHMGENVSEAVQTAGREKSRKRTPSLEEVRAIWDASKAQGDLWGPFFRLCILTGQRSRSDVLRMEWSWIDWERERYEVPDPKNDQPHIVHLCNAALEELRNIKERQEKGKLKSSFVFTTTGRTAASGVSKAKSSLDKALGDEFEAWVLHDLRRSQATALAEAGFDEGVVDRIQNHVAGGSRASAVAVVYNKARKLPERRKALNAWADMVLGRWGQVHSIGEAQA